MFTTDIYPANSFAFRVEAAKLKKKGFSLCRIGVMGDHDTTCDVWHYQIGETTGERVYLWYPEEF